MYAEIQSSMPYRITWWRGVLWLLALGVLDCLVGWGLIQVAGLTVSYAHDHGVNDTIGLSIWVVVLGWATGIVLHLVALSRAAQHQQKAKAAVLILILSSLWLTWLCAIAGAFSAYATLMGDIFHAFRGR